jgi:hypothetical protein
MHTPTPWNVTRDENDARALIRDGNFMRVAECGRAFVPGIAEANAAFIVRAVNAHEALVELARRVAEHFAHTDAPLGIAARDALAKAGEGA